MRTACGLETKAKSTELSNYYDILTLIITIIIVQFVVVVLIIITVCDAVNNSEKTADKVG